MNLLGEAANIHSLSDKNEQKDEEMNNTQCFTFRQNNRFFIEHNLQFNSTFVLTLWWNYPSCLTKTA